jgi:hypothetical protein
MPDRDVETIQDLIYYQENGVRSTPYLKELVGQAPPYILKNGFPPSWE